MLYWNYLKKLSIITLILIAFTTTGWAASGLSVSPADINVKINSTQLSQEEISVVNIGDSPLNVNITKKRMMKNNAITLYADDGIATWITVDPAQFSLAPKETKKVKVSINIPANLNYTDAMGALIIKGSPVESNQNQSSSGTNLMVKQAPAVLVPVIVGLPGQIIESLGLSSHKSSLLLLNFMPGNFNYNVTNNGTVSENATTTTQINGWFSKHELKSSGTVFPGDNYYFKNTWTPDIYDFGIYTAETNITYGKYGANQTIVQKDNVFVIPVWLIILILLALTVWILRKKDIKSPIVIKRRND